MNITHIMTDNLPSTKKQWLQTQITDTYILSPVQASTYEPPQPLCLENRDNGIRKEMTYAARTYST